MGPQFLEADGALGDTVNLASRLEGLNKRYGTQVMAEQSVVDAAASAYRWRRLDRVAVVGRSEPTWVYELLDDDRADERVERYEAAWDLYARREFRQAADILETLATRHADAPSRRLLALCRALEAEPPAPDWDAVTRPSSK